MAYENVDTSRLRAAINDCKNTLSYSSSNSAINGLTDDVWSGSAKKNLTSALNKLVNTRYKEIEDTLDEYLSVVDSIESYQSASSTLGSLQTQKANKEQQLRIEKAKAVKDQNKINRLQSEINSLNSQIYSQNSKINQISIDV